MKKDCPPGFMDKFVAYMDLLAEQTDPDFHIPVCCRCMGSYASYYHEDKPQYPLCQSCATDVINEWLDSLTTNQMLDSFGFEPL